MNFVKKVDWQTVIDNSELYESTPLLINVILNKAFCFSSGDTEKLLRQLYKKITAVRVQLQIQP